MTGSTDVQVEVSIAIGALNLAMGSTEEGRGDEVAKVTGSTRGVEVSMAIEAVAWRFEGIDGVRDKSTEGKGSNVA